ncbi:MAG TPA: hypothetical protein VKC61_00645 [Pyrinomonadaceae bacterium]|nr:hypothetical protein [Pyrinomonadaceae bacterium]
MKATFLFAIRLIALSIVYFVCFAAVSGALLSPAAGQSDPGQAGAALAALLAVSVLNSAVLTYVIIRSRWGGWKLILAIFFVLYGVTTFMSQIETAFFVTGLPPGMLPRLFLAGAIIAALVSPLAVLILGKRKPDRAADENHLRLNMPFVEWVGKLCLIVIAYVIIYFTFGYFIAWQSAAVRAYYGGRDPGSFLAQISSVIRETSWLIPLQAVRALLWAALALPVIRMMKGRWWEAGLAVALLFGVVMNTQLLLPNPLMPQEVRMMHLLETATSNFLFGWLIVLVLCWRRRSEREPARL